MGMALEKEKGVLLNAGGRVQWSQTPGEGKVSEH